MSKCRIYLIALLITVSYIIYSIIIFKLVMQTEYIDWNKNAILVAKDSNYKVDFIFPKHHKILTINNLENIVKPYKIRFFYYNVIIDDSRLIISFLTDDDFYNNIVISYNIMDLSDKKIIHLGSNNINNLQIPKIFLSKNFYYIINSNGIYQLDKSFSNMNILPINFCESILVDNNDTIFFNRDNTILTYKNGKEKIIYNFTDNVYILGWYKQNESILVLNKNNDYTILDYNGNILGTIKIPVDDYSTIINLGTIGNDSLVYFFNKSGQIPFWDSDMFINSFIDGVKYNYLEYFMYSSKDNKFYKLDSATSNLIQAKYIERFYDGQFDIDKLLNFEENEIMKLKSF